MTRGRPLAASTAAVVTGGAIGTALRLAIDTALPHSDTELPVSTLVINLVGSFALGVLVARVWPVAPEWLRAGLGPGLLGSFTTFSAVTVSLLTLVDAGAPALAAAYLVVSVAGGLALAWAGLRLGGTGRAPVDAGGDE